MPGARPLTATSPSRASRKSPRLLVRRRADHHAPRLRHLLEPRGQVGGIADRRVIHPEVIPDFPHHDQPRVQAKAHLQAEPALGLEGLGDITNSPLNA